MKPQNYAVMIGQEVTMQCQTNETTNLRWDGHRPAPPKKDDVLIYNGYQFSSYAASFCKPISSVDGDYSLLISASREAAMRYKCLEPGSLESWSAQLIALESDLTCKNTTSTSDVDYVNIMCFIDFYGHWAPTIEWRRCDVADETVIKAGVSNSVSPNERVTSTFTMKQNDNNGTCYKVTAMFKKDAQPFGTYAENVPSYSYTIFFNQSSESHRSMEEDGSIILMIVAVTAVVTIIVGVTLFIVLLSQEKQQNEDSQDV